MLSPKDADRWQLGEEFFFQIDSHMRRSACSLLGVDSKRFRGELGREMHRAAAQLPQRTPHLNDLRLQSRGALVSWTGL